MAKGPVGVSVPVVAKKRVTTVEPRGTGTWGWEPWELHPKRVWVVPQGRAPGRTGKPGLGFRADLTVDRLENR